jgi:hypothetical protein
MKSAGDAFILLTHVNSPIVWRELKKIEAACKGLGDAWLLVQGSQESARYYEKAQRMEVCSLEDAMSLGFPAKGPYIVPGHAHFSIVRFSQNHPGYRRYWMIEYDCRFSGSWRVLFNAYQKSNADFCASHICTYQEEPEWSLWDLSHPKKEIPPEQRLRCFHPVYRISKPALEFIENAHKDGWMGHSEVLIPTLLHLNGYKLLDFGGDGQFVLPGMQNKFYIAQPANPKGHLRTGTLRWRPEHDSMGNLKNKIYHPVKFDEKTQMPALAQTWIPRLRPFYSWLPIGIKQTIKNAARLILPGL